MFEKQRESLEASKNYQKVKLHVQAHQMAYTCLGSATVSGAVVAILKSRPTIVNNITQVTPNIAPVINNAPIFNNTVNNGGYARKIIRCVETDELWPSMSKAAESAGHTLQAMSRHIHGYNDHLDGLHYVIEGVTAS